MRILFILFSFCFITSCTWDVDTTPIPGNSPLSDGNSKVWLVSHLIKNELDYVQPENFERDLIVFYSSGKCKIIKWKYFGVKKGDIFDYKLNRYQDKSPTLTLTRNLKKWKFSCAKFNDEEIKLIPLKGTDFKYEMTIIPIPEW